MNPASMHSPEAERAVLAAMLRRNGCIPDVVRVLRSEDLYADAHQRIWSAIVALWDRGRPADLVTVADQLQAPGQTENVGGYVYLAEVHESSGTSANVEHYARIVLDCAQRAPAAPGRSGDRPRR